MKIKNERGSSYIEFLIIFPFVLMLTFVGLFSLLNMQLKNQMNDQLKNALREAITSETYFDEDGVSNAVDVLEENLSLFDSELNPEGWFIEYVRIYQYDLELGSNSEWRELLGVPPVRDLKDMDQSMIMNWRSETTEHAREMNDLWKIGNELEVRIWRPTQKRFRSIVNSIFTINFFDKKFHVVEGNVVVTGRITIENEVARR